MSGSPRGLASLSRDGRTGKYSSGMRGAKIMTRHVPMLPVLCSSLHCPAFLFAAVCVIFIQPLLGFFNLTDAETYTAARSYTLITCGLIPFFLSESDADRTLYCAGRFPHSPACKLYRACRKYDPGSAADPWHRTFPEAGGCRSRYCDSKFTDSGFCGDGSAYPAFQTGAQCFTASESAVCFFQKNIISTFSGSGFPTAIQGSIYCFISMVLTRMVSGYGAAAIATQRVGGQIESVSWNTADGFCFSTECFYCPKLRCTKKRPYP